MGGRDAEENAMAAITGDEEGKSTKVDLVAVR